MNQLSTETGRSKYSDMYLEKFKTFKSNLNYKIFIST